MEASTPSTGPSSPRSKGGVPVYVMLPLDTVSRDGELQRVEELTARLRALRRAGVEGVMMDVWWGIVERRGPGLYDWAAYLRLVELVERIGLKIHAVLSFHACGANKDDDYHVPHPPWVAEATSRDPDGFLFTDRGGSRSDEYLSLWADHAPLPTLSAGSSVPPRAPLDCYRDVMASFRAAFEPSLGDVITEVLVGCGPCGELRYPAYAMSRGWRFPGVGEFQCYDRRARESLQNAAVAVGRPEWGNGGPHDAGSYNSRPDETGFFANGRGGLGRGRGGSEKNFSAVTPGSPAGPPHKLFPSRSMPIPALAPDSPSVSRSNVGNGGPPSPTEPRATKTRDAGGPRSASLDDLSARETGGGESGGAPNGANGAASALFTSADMGATPSPNGRWDSEYGRFFLQWYSGELVAHGERVMQAASDAFRGSGGSLGLKCAGIHWWYRTRSHAAELTTGYYHVEGGCETTGSESAPAPAGSMNGGGGGVGVGGGGSGAGSQVDVRRASMDWVPGPGRTSVDGGAGVGAGGLSRKWSSGSFGSHGSLKALERAPGAGASGSSSQALSSQFSGYDRIMQMCKATGASVTFTCAEMSDGEHDPRFACGPEGLLREVVAAAGRAGVRVSAENALYRCDATAFKQMVRNCKRGCAGSGEGMRSFTFLRLCDSLVEEAHFAEFEKFVRDLGGTSEGGSP